MPNYNITFVLKNSQWIPIHIPISSSIRVFKKIYGDVWSELNRSDLVEVRATNNFTYDDKIYVFMFHPLLEGGEINIQYDHNDIPNPGTIDILPFLLTEQTYYLYNRIISGMFVNRSYTDGLNTGWTGSNIFINGGCINILGELYTVGDTHWDLNYFGLQAGSDMVTSTLFYLSSDLLGDESKYTKYIPTPSYIISKRYELDQGGGISSSLTDLNNQLALILRTNVDRVGFIEIVRMVIVSKTEGTPADIDFFYEKKFRTHYLS